MSTASPRPAHFYRCDRCDRRFVAFDDDRSADLLCLCGAELVTSRPPSGLFEVLSSSSVAQARRDGHDGRDSSERDSAVLPEADLGYGPSHGNEESRGGPTGPGDAPAIVDHSERG
jgi:hypothetical protein